MAVDIGPKIGIDGEAEFRKQINLISQQVKTFGSELQAVTSEFDQNADSMESLSAKNTVLNKSIGAQEQKLEQLKKGLSESQRLYGENDTKTLQWQQTVNRATADLNKMKSQVKNNEHAMEDLGDEVDDTAEAMEDAGESAHTFGDLLKANLVTDMVVGALKGIAGGLKQITEESKEYRKIMGSLEISSEQAGYSAQETTQTYKELYGVLADNQTAATTTANLQALGLAQEDLNKLMDGTVGAWAKYGDSIPIDGLAEAINETVKTGAVTGTFADVLNWAGSSEDDFNAKLEKAGNSTERANLVLQELADQGLMDAGKAWQENNKSLVEANQAAAGFEDTTAKIGEKVEPVMTAVQEAMNGILLAVLNLISGWDFEKIANGIRDFSSLFLGLTTDFQSGSQGISDAFSKIQEKVKEILHKILLEIKARLPDFIKSGTEMVKKLISGITEVIPKLNALAGQMLSEILDIILSNLPEILKSGTEILLSLIKGISGMLPKLAETAVSIIKKLISNLIHNLPDILETGVTLLGELAAGIIKALPDIIEAALKIISGIVNELKQYDWKQVGKDILAGLANGIRNFIGDVIDAAKEAAGQISKAFKDFFDIHSPSRLMRDEVGRQITRGIAEGIRADKNYAKKSAEEVSDAILKAAEKKLSNYKVYNDLTLADEAAFWDEIRREATEGTQARIDADKKYYDAKKALNDQLVSTEKEYKETISKIHKELSENIQSAWKGYQDELDSVSKSIKSQMGLFDRFEAETELTAEDLLDNLESQVYGLRDWQNSLNALKDRNVPDEFVKELEDMGVSAAGEVELLNEMTDSELSRYVRMWRDKNMLAREAAEEQLEPLLKTTRQQIGKLQAEAAKELDAYQNEYIEAMEQIGVLLVQPLTTIKKELLGNFTSIVGMIASTIGFQAGTKQNQNQYSQVAKNIVAAAAGLPDDFYAIGTNTVDSTIQGLQSKEGSLYAYVENMMRKASEIATAAIGSDYGSLSADYSNAAPRTANASATMLSSISQNLANMRVVLNDGTLVGKLSPRIDGAIGGYTRTTGRYFT